VLEKIKRLYRRHYRKFTGFLLGLILLVWLLGPALVEYLSLEVSIGVSLAVIIVMLGLVTDYMADIVKPSHVQVSSVQSEITSNLMNFIKTEKPRTASILMYSSSVFREIVQALIDVEVQSELFLLLQSPKKQEVFIKYQKGRICGGIEVLAEMLRGYNKAKIRVYKEPASLRGIKLGNKLISIGWYTYDCRDKTLGDKQIWGHKNAMVTAPLGTVEGRVLRKNFDEVFKNLWNNSSSLMEICGSCSKKKSCLGTDPDEWLDLVSQK